MGSRRFTLRYQGILPMIIIQFVLRMGGMLTSAMRKSFFLYNEATRNTADVISTFCIPQRTSCRGAAQTNGAIQRQSGYSIR